MNKTVYLAGPISLCKTVDDAMEWRERVRKELAVEGIRALSPMRAGVYIKDGDSDDCMSNPRGITTRDRMDCTKCDVVMMNLLGTKKISVGTMIEIGWADANRIPIVLVIEDKGNPHDHPMVNQCIGFRTNTVEQGVEVVKKILEGY